MRIAERSERNRADSNSWIGSRAANDFRIASPRSIAMLLSALSAAELVIRSTGAGHVISGCGSVYHGADCFIPVRPIGLSWPRRSIACLGSAHLEPPCKSPVIQPYFFQMNAIYLGLSNRLQPLRLSPLMEPRCR